ncbi:PREDICTED: ELMO domain-containing protein A isoform X3 [Nicotiana attenuata]|uniref:ELMO domain-containing protein A isoform X3 n=1 Tax=Nicotiana attenuata TaxID=49451 RepID=UPI0009056599|nr:PREDICTED: ELMO domain-containing protein A isoform X3 [Nicotiana attenuata]
MRLRRSQCILSCASSHHKADEDESNWQRRKLDEEPAWSHNSPHVISQLAQCFSNAMVGPRAWIGGIFNRSGNRRFGSDKYLDYPLTPLQEALQALWNAAFPNVKLKSLISEQWKDMGWQGANPSTDFRGCGFISLENLLFFATRYPACFHRLLFKRSGSRATWEYPFAVAGINVTFMLIQMLDLYSEKPKCLPGINFVKLLGEDDEAFDVLYCIAFAMMDAQWLAMCASYMEFKDVLQATRTQLERELSLEDIQRIEDLPAYNLI